jgi:cyclomaltodextrinase / maltogenic alpha-amylase / neopullulanase
MRNFLTRKFVFQLCLAVAMGINIVACQPALATKTQIATASPSAIPVTVNLSSADQDVWTWTKPVQVEVSEPGGCQGMVVYVNDREFQAQPAGEIYSAEVKFSEGANQVRAACLQSSGEATQSDPVTYTERLRQVPTALIQISLEDGKIVLDGSGSLPAEEGPTLTEFAWSAREDNPVPLQLENGGLTDEVSGPSITLLSPKVDGEYYATLRVKDADGREDTSTNYFVVENGKPRIPDYDKENPAWTENAIVYGVVPFLFGSPAFNAIGEHLADLADLGINTLWLGPINLHPADDYGYAVEDYFSLDPAYGSEEDFRNLVNEAHAHGIRVIMDFVPNHTSDTHPYFKDAQERGRSSPYWDFYDRDASGNPTHSLESWTNLPSLNYSNPEVRRMMIEAFSYWIREFDVDGFRVDAAWAVKERNPEYWPEWRRELKRVKPDLLLLAEASARDPYYFDNGFDAAYDWTYHVGDWAWGEIWNAYKFRLLAYNLTDAVTNSPEGFHPDALILHFLNNNDTYKRFIARYGEGVTQVATALLLTLPGIPSIYTGDEYGLEFYPYQQVEPLKFEEQYPGLRDYHKKLISLRKSLPSLHSRNLYILKPDAVPQAIYGYVRYGEPSDPPVLVLLNFSEEPAEFSFDIPEQFSSLSASSLFDLLTEEDVPVSGDDRMQISVPGQTARILVTEPPE